MAQESNVCMTGRGPGCHCLVAIMANPLTHNMADVQVELYNFVVDKLDVALEDGSVITEFKNCPHNDEPSYKHLPSPEQFQKANVILDALKVMRALTE